MSARWDGPEAARHRADLAAPIRRAAWLSFASGLATGVLGAVVLGALGWLPVLIDTLVRSAR